MEQEESAKKMKEIQKKKRRPAYIFLLIISALIVTYAGVSIYNYIKKEQLKEEVATNKSDKAFEWANKINADTVFQESDLGSIRYNQSIIKDSKFAVYDNKQVALDKINQCKIRVKSGVKIYDEFDRFTILKDRTKYIIVTLEEYFNERNTYIKIEHSGYKNSVNRKADDLHKKFHWNKSMCTTIAKGKVSLGMTTAMVIRAWGRPRDINRTVGSWGVHEQWVYSANYLYFEDGILTSWQD